MAKFSNIDRQVYLEIFDSFSADTGEIAEGYFDGDKAKARRSLNKLEAAGLIVGSVGSEGTIGNGRGQGHTERQGAYSSKVWQAVESYDYISRDEAVARYEAAVGGSATVSAALEATYSKTERESVKRPGFKLDNALWLSTNADTQEGRDWWALYYVRMAKLAPQLVQE